MYISHNEIPVGNGSTENGTIRNTQILAQMK